MSKIKTKSIQQWGEQGHVSEAVFVGLCQPSCFPTSWWIRTFNQVKSSKAVFHSCRTRFPACFTHYPAPTMDSNMWQWDICRADEHEHAGQLVLELQPFFLTSALGGRSYSCAKSLNAFAETCIVCAAGNYSLASSFFSLKYRKDCLKDLAWIELHLRVFCCLLIAWY